MVIVGVDLAGVERRDTGFCVLEGFDARTCILHSDSQIIEETVWVKPKVVSIDAPLALPKGRCCLRDDCECRERGGHFRQCDLELRRMGIPFFPVTLGPMRSLTERGIKVKKSLGTRGFKVMETYPGGAQDIWNIPRKKDIQGLRDGLKRLGVRGDIDKTDVSSHELDAITCALVGRLFVESSHLSLGDPEEILMILPKVKG